MMVTPNRPNTPAPKSRAKRKIVPTSIRGGTIKVATAVREITITIAGPIRPADTAACPITRAPTIFTACPKGARHSDAGLPQNFKNDDHQQCLQNCRKWGSLPGGSHGDQQRCGDQFVIKTAQSYKVCRR
jgi:hypothetical protein